MNLERWGSDEETKKYNYFMNDFGTSLAPAIAYLPTSNQNRETCNGLSGQMEVRAICFALTICIKIVEKIIKCSVYRKTKK